MKHFSMADNSSRQTSRAMTLRGLRHRSLAQSDKRMRSLPFLLSNPMIAGQHHPF